MMLPGQLGVYQLESLVSKGNVNLTQYANYLTIISSFSIQASSFDPLTPSGNPGGSVPLKHWINRGSKSKNVVIAMETAFLVGSCSEDNHEHLNQQLMARTPPPNVDGLEDVAVYPFTAVHRIKSLSTDGDVEIRYRKKKSTKTLSVKFESADEAKEFIEAFEQKLPNTMQKNAHQQTIFTAALMPFICILLGLIIGFIYFNKLRILTYIVCGAWILGSIYMLVTRVLKPPLITRWSINGKFGSRLFARPKRVWGIGIVFVAIAGFGYFNLPDAHGPKAIFDSYTHNSLSAGDIQKYVDRGAEIDYTDADGNTTLAHAINYSQDDLALALISAGANVNLPSSNLLEMSFSHDTDTVALALIRAGAKTSNGYILESALSNGAGDGVIRALLNGGALDAARDVGFNPFDYLKEHGHETFEQLLHEHRRVSINRLYD